MWILKSINNSCAYGRDSQGQDVIVFGKGIGFKRAPYELTDLSLIERTFYGVKPSVAGMIATIPDDCLLVAADIAAFARARLAVGLNPNFPITLADHLNFALVRLRDGIDLETPLAHDVRHLFPRETNIARRAVALVRDRLGVELPEAEVANIALHLIDAETEQGDMNSTRKATTIVRDVTAIVERDLATTLDTESSTYARFVMHLRYLAARIESGGEQNTNVAEMLPTLQKAYPQSWEISRDIIDYLEPTWEWTCDESESLYLLVHVERLRSSLQ